MNVIYTLSDIRNDAACKRESLPAAPSSQKPDLLRLRSNHSNFYESYGLSNALDRLSAHSFLDDMQAGVLIVDSSGMVRFLNHSARRLIGIAPDEVCHCPLGTLFSLINDTNQQFVSSPIAYLLARASTGLSGYYEILIRRDGTTIPVNFSINRINVDNRDDNELILLILCDANQTFMRMEHLAEVARHDEHTRLLRRGELERRLGRVLNTMSDGDHHALLFMDLDHFKEINDKGGHAAGDAALREVASLFRAQVRERDTLARLGGDEFGLFLEHCQLELARDRARSLQMAVAEHEFEVEGHVFELGVSIGIASIRHGHHDVKAVMAAADKACYMAKRGRCSALHIETVILDQPDIRPIISSGGNNAIAKLSCGKQ